MVLKQLRPLMREAHYYRLCEGFNAAASWRAWELIAHGLLHVLPPLAVQIIRSDAVMDVVQDRAVRKM